MERFLNHPPIYFVIALLITLVGTPIARAIALKFNIVANPTERRLHRTPTPILGGVFVFIALIFSGILALNNLISLEPMSPLYLLVSFTIIFLTGISDDLFKVPPGLKMTLIGIGATILYLGGYSVEFTSWHFINYPLTLFWFLGITNAANLMDNMDGLASGCAVISGFFMAWLATMRHDPLLIAFALILSGAYFGFLKYNFPKATIFLGDAGSVLLGFSLATLGLAIGRHTNVSMTLAPIVLLGLFIFDTFFVAFSRWARKTYFWEGGLDHTSHRFVSLGFSKTKAVMLVWGLNILFGLNAVIIWNSPTFYAVSLVLIILILGIIFWRKLNIIPLIKN